MEVKTNMSNETNEVWDAERNYEAYLNGLRTARYKESIELLDSIDSKIRDLETEIQQDSKKSNPRFEAYVERDRAELAELYEARKILRGRVEFWQQEAKKHRGLYKQAVALNEEAERIRSSIDQKIEEIIALISEFKGLQPEAGEICNIYENVTLEPKPDEDPRRLLQWRMENPKDYLRRKLEKII